MASLSLALFQTGRSRSTILRGNTQGSVHRLRASITFIDSKQSKRSRCGANTFTFAEMMHPVSLESDLASPNESRLRRRHMMYNGMNDLIQMADFFDLIGASNRDKIRYIKLEINVYSLFLGHTPFPTHKICYSAQSLLGGGVSEPDVYAQILHWRLTC